MISIGLENLCGDSGNEITSVLKPGLLCVEISLIVVGLTLEFLLLISLCGSINLIH